MDKELVDAVLKGIGDGKRVIITDGKNVKTDDRFEDAILTILKEQDTYVPFMIILDKLMQRLSRDVDENDLNDSLRSMIAEGIVKYEGKLDTINSKYMLI